MSEPRPDFLAVRNLTKIYENGQVEALKDVSFRIDSGERIALVGPSGCGKSTLLGLLGALDRPTSGRVEIEGEDISLYRSMHRFRATFIGFVFQYHHLVPTMTLLENVVAPMIATGMPKQLRTAKAYQLLCDVGIGHRATFTPASVSGGERQRAAIARALANDPRLILADEPTGNLDSVSGAIVADLILNYSCKTGATVIIATHNPELALRADRIIPMRDGAIELPPNLAETGIR